MRPCSLGREDITMFLVFLVNILFAFVCPVGKLALLYTSPLFLTGFRMIVGSLVVLGYQYFFRRAHFTVTRAAWWPLGIAALFTIYLTNWLEFAGLEHLSPAKTTFLYNLYPFVAALLSFFYLKERLSRKQQVGILMGILGSLPLLISIDPAGPQLTKYFGLLSLPELALLVSVVAAPLGWLFIQEAVCSHGCDSIMANGVTMLLGGLLALLHSYGTELWQPVPVSNLRGFALTTGGLLVLSNIVCNTLYIELLKSYSVTFLSFTGFITPLITALIDWLLFGYTVSPAFYVSSVLMAGGFFLFYRYELES